MKQSRIVRKTKNNAALMGMIGILGLAPATIALASYLPGATVAEATVNIDILSEMSSSNSSGTSLTNPWLADGQTRVVNFTITGSKLLNVSTDRTGSKQVYLGVPSEMLGNVTSDGQTEVDSNVTLDLDNISFLNTVFTTAQALNGQVLNILSGTLGNLTGVYFNVQDFNEKLEVLENVEHIGNVNIDADSELASSGKYISSDIEDSLGITLAANVRKILIDLKTATTNLKATGSGITSNYVAGLINTTLIPVKAALVNAIDLALPLLDNGGQAVDELVDASILGDTNVVVPVKITSPLASPTLNNLLDNDTTDLKFPGVVIQTDTNLDKLVTFREDYYSHIYYKK